VKRISFKTIEQVELPDSEWQALMQMFMDRLNPGREKAGYKPLSASRVAKMLSDAGYGGTTKARDFYKKLDTEAKNFSQLFHHLTEV
jgi:hypothetical protein